MEKKSGAELLEEALNSYPPMAFYSVALDPKISLNDYKKPYISVTEKFNEDLFWKEFLPRLRTALDGVAEKKEKLKYDSSVRRANKKLNEEKFAENMGVYNKFMFKDKYGEKPYNSVMPYSWWSAESDKEAGLYSKGGFLRGYSPDMNVGNTVPRIVVPENDDEYTVYTLPTTFRKLFDEYQKEAAVSATTLSLPSQFRIGIDFSSGQRTSS